MCIERVVLRARLAPVPRTIASTPDPHLVSPLCNILYEGASLRANVGSTGISLKD